MADTKIEWCDRVWNPVTGCSMGCEFCYARRMHNRHLPGHKSDGVPFKKSVLHHDRLAAPFRWRKPQSVFVCSMGDLWGSQVPFDFIDRVMAVISLCPQHTFIDLTKQPGRRMEYMLQTKGRRVVTTLPNRDAFAATWTHSASWPLPNLIQGVSVTKQADADERIPILLRTPAAMRCVSVEPMLGPVNLSRWMPCPCYSSGNATANGMHGLDWVIAGGQTGPGAKPVHPDWMRSLRDRCATAGVPFFLKSMHIDGRIVKMPELDGKVWNEFPRVLAPFLDE
jgi:protein gp37